MAELLYFSAPWCGPCRALKPVIDDIERDGLISLVRIDVDNEPKLTNQYNVRSVPTFIFRDDEGAVLDMHVGMINRVELVAMIERALG